MRVCHKAAAAGRREEWEGGVLLPGPHLAEESLPNLRPSLCSVPPSAPEAFLPVFFLSDELPGSVVLSVIVAETWLLTTFLVKSQLL